MSLTPPCVDFYRGATFSRTDPSFILLAGTWTAVAQVRDTEDPWDVITDLDVTLTLLDAPTYEYSIVISCPAEDTEAWPLRRLACNILFIDASNPAVRVPTTGFLINVKRPPSEAA